MSPKPGQQDDALRAITPALTQLERIKLLAQASWFFVSNMARQWVRPERVFPIYLAGMCVVGYVFTIYLWGWGVYAALANAAFSVIAPYWNVAPSLNLLLIALPIAVLSVPHVTLMSLGAVAVYASRQLK